MNQTIKLAATLSALVLVPMYVPLVKAQSPTPITFQYFYDDLNQLVKAVDSTGVALTYVYDAVGNITQIGRASVAPGALTIFSFTPQNVTAGATVTIQGQGFSPIISNDIVMVNGMAAQVISASATTLVIAVAGNATTGVITVTVGSTSATSTTPLTIVPLPVIMSITPKSALAGTPLTASVTGLNLSGSTFSFNGLSYPSPVTVMSATVDQSGTSATLAISINPTAIGRFTLMATSTTGSSDPTQRIGFIKGTLTFNTLTVPGSNANADPDLDGLTNAQEIALGTDPLNPDTDVDGFPDDMEVILGSDPLNPLSVPNISPPTTQQPNFTFSLLNGADPGSTAAMLQAPFAIFSVLNGPPAASAQISSENLVHGSDKTNSSAQTNPSIPSANQVHAYFIFSITNGKKTAQQSLRAADSTLNDGRAAPKSAQSGKQK